MVEGDHVRLAGWWELEERLKPRTTELEILLRWSRDGSANVAGRTYTGHGPRYGPQTVAASGALLRPVVADGTLRRVPVSAAKTLRDSGLVELVGTARWSAALEFFRAVGFRETLSTAVDLAAAAALCRGWATELERYGARWLAEEQQAEAEFAQQQAARVEQVPVAQA